MRSFFIILFLLFFTNLSYAKTADSKNFAANSDVMYMITLGALNKLGFEIVELQANSGYISFKNGVDEYLVMVTENGESSSNIKILKLKNSSPLVDIQDKIYAALNSEIYNAPKRADQ